MNESEKTQREVECSGGCGKTKAVTVRDESQKTSYTCPDCAQGDLKQEGTKKLFIEQD